MQLIIVESPTKAKTIQKFLGSKYKITSSFGHVRDLPKSKLGVDVDKNFEPSYIIPTKAKKVVSQLKKDAKAADEVILATDQDREGESISWHLSEALNLTNPKRIVFHEITEEAIKEALQHPGVIDMKLVDAQQARRILDRIVGYKLSPFLWKKIAKGLSAGRVQSVAVRLVVEKEEEIKKFVAVEYWDIEAVLKKSGAQFSAFLTKKDGKSIDKLEINNKKETDQILKNLDDAKYQIEKITKKETRRNPLPPFTTSTLQQTAATRFHFPAKMTMSVAQKLYEQGHITYHRTDSLNLSQTSLVAAQKFIKESFGEKYFKGAAFKAKGNAQEAHEAIRPTHASQKPENLKGELEGTQFKLYALIWQRFIASQMSPAVFDSTSIEVAAGPYTFGANGQMLKFDGFLKVYPMKFSENEMPKLEEKDVLELAELKSAQHFTEPPARYNEASLIKALEAYGIGRPSTYAPTLSTVQDRHYIEKNDQKRFVPTEMGTLVTEVLMKNFPQIVDIEFTAKMEKELDEVAEGKDTWQKTIKDFYGPFAKNLKEKYDEVPKENLDIATDKVCPKCGKPMIEKMGRFGRFYACTGFPECKHTESIVKAGGGQKMTIDMKCPKCKEGNIVVKKTKRGKIFYGCDTYPACDFAAWDKPINRFCPTCQSILTQTLKGAVKCSNKTCDYKEDANADSKTDQ
ncbi:type I DNA topoisomerase [Candidatus Parcubacteria bacterium]|nr:type I DNA topoisomerase [Candidatus Parcubacteria bacterium]